MVARLSTFFPLALTALSTGAQAAAVSSDVSPAVRSPLEVRDLCCALSVDTRFVQLVCSYMEESCGGWRDCLSDENDIKWCQYCVVKHPEDDQCLKKTWPPVGPAPNTNDDDPVDFKLISDAGSSSDIVTEETQIKKRAVEQIHTAPYQLNTAQTYTRSFGLITFRLIVSAANVVTYSIQNSGLGEYAWELFDITTGWFVQGDIEGGATIGGHAPSHVLAKAGDFFELEVEN